MNVGDRVRVCKPITVYHHPSCKGQPFNIEGMEGEVSAILDNWHGRPISANYKIQVTFPKKFRVHLHASELELIT
ncbi:MAG: ferredoxin-thioredoxin reductase variable chain [Cyanobacteria bacterium]|nr:ferredoxin-thioredoxin reductase variable chain [Cyanobacteriota bacterium]MDW8201988.1 ferredoxin-thioredoxin reductase variable chain [Cyanobacteriota bacterium SKYGB_h_bin112]